MGIRFLIEDDSGFSRRAMRKMLEEHRNVVPKSGAVIAGESKILVQADRAVIGEAADGEEAVQQYRRLSPDIVMMDITMPQMDGLEALNSMACVIMVTARRKGTGGRSGQVRRQGLCPEAPQSGDHLPNDRKVPGVLMPR